MALFIWTRKPPVDLYLAFVVHPRDAENDHSLGLGHPLEDLRLAILGVFLDDGNETRIRLAHRLEELDLTRVLRFH